MQNKSISAIGLMSGTSLDGLDLAYCQFKWTNGQWKWEFIVGETAPYEQELIDSLKDAPSLSGKELISLDHYFGKWMGRVTKEFITKNHLKPDLVASHGHTIFHQPERGISLQIGSLNALYREIRLPVINNFRQLDVLKGGQGAPLVPIGDELLFKEHQFCLNLGGIANISFLDDQSKRVAFDISVCNLGLNYLAQKEGLPFDEDGKLANSGIVDTELLEKLSEIAYYKITGPKSLGLEDVEKEVFPLLEASTISNADKMATLIHHISEEICKVLNGYPSKEGSILISGGGAFNKTLIQSISAQLNPKLRLAKVNKDVINYKEAIIFAFMGVLRVQDQVNVYASVTGAQSDSVAGDMIGKVCI